MFNGHLDTVPADGMSDAFAPRVEDGILRGRGACDITRAHGPDDQVRLDELVRAAELYLDLTLRLVGHTSSSMDNLKTVQGKTKPSLTINEGLKLYKNAQMTPYSAVSRGSHIPAIP